MIGKSEWESLGWTTRDDNVRGFNITRDSEVACDRCGEVGPWTLRALPNGEMAHRDYAVCRCGELMHANTVWPDTPRP